MVISERFFIDIWVNDSIFGIHFIAWIASIVHVFKARTEYLLRLEAKSVIWGK